VNRRALQVYEKHLKDAFGALLDVYSGCGQPMVYFYSLADSSDDVSSSKSSDVFVPARHVIMDTSVPFSIDIVSLANALDTPEVHPQPVARPHCVHGIQNHQQLSARAETLPLEQHQMPPCQQQLNEMTRCSPGRHSDESDRTEVFEPMSDDCTADEVAQQAPSACRIQTICKAGNSSAMKSIFSGGARDFLSFDVNENNPFETGVLGDECDGPKRLNVISDDSMLSF
jgi:hypothetical protein